MADVFLSYAREDKETAHRLADAMEARGFEVWWDAEIPPGETLCSARSNKWRPRRGWYRPQRP